METKKRLSREEKLQTAIVDIINKMFEIAGHNVTYDDVIGVDNWFQKHTMTVEQSEEWKSWGVGYLQDKLKMTKKMAEREMMWFNLQWGLTYSDFPTQK